jgi:ATP-dependent DNA helicase UvrD/PcrA
VGFTPPSYQHLRRPEAPRSTEPPRPAPKNESVNGVLSFFQNAPVQFDPSAITAAKQQQASTGGAAELKRGQKVRHEQFGVGTILTMEGSGPDAKLTVYFDRVGSKKFIARYAKLTRV